MQTETDALQDISSDEAILVEYLDGELSVQERRIVEERLAKEPAFRETLARLEESWQFLDFLEREDTDKELVETTMEVVALQAEESIEAKQIEGRKRLTLKNVLLALLFLFIFHFAFIHGEMMGDKHFLLRIASPIIERLDMYLPLLDEDPELLRILAERRLFLPPRPEGSSPLDPKYYEPSPSVYVLESFALRPSFAELNRRVERIKNFDESLYSRFYNNYENFKSYSREKKNRLREIHEAIIESPGRQELFQTLQNYHTWRKSLQSYEKAELRRPMSAAERVEQIAALKQRLDAHLHDDDATPLIEDLQQDNESKRLAETLRNMPGYDRERLLDAPPDQIIRILVQRSEEREK